MNYHNLKKIDYWVIGFGLIAITFAIVISGTTAFLSSLWGAVLALVNWMLFRYLGSRMALAQNKNGIGLIIGMKSIFILATIAVSYILFRFHLLWFMAGISSLLAGVIGYALMPFSSKGDEILKKEHENA
jgi:phosphatidylglycerophosphate synthase